MTATTFRQRLMAGAVVAVLASALTACSGTIPTVVPEASSAPSASASASASAAPAAPTCDNATQSYAPTGPLPTAEGLPEGSTMAAIRARGRLIVGVSADTYLLGARNPLTGQIEGFDIDLAKQVAKAILEFDCATDSSQNITLGGASGGVFRAGLALPAAWRFDHTHQTTAITPNHSRYFIDIRLQVKPPPPSPATEAGQNKAINSIAYQTKRQATGGEIYHTFITPPAPPATVALTNRMPGCCAAKTSTSASRPAFSEPVAHQVNTST